VWYTLPGMISHKNNRAFTLIETIIAIGVLTIAMIAAIQLAASSNRLSSLLMQRFTAHHLAEEGVEIIRNMRDTNWLKNIGWRSGLVDGRYAIAERSSVAATTLDPKMHPLFILNAAGSIERAETITVGETIRYQRMIELSTPDPESEIMHVRSVVEYNFRGTPQQAVVEAELSDWKKGPL